MDWPTATPPVPNDCKYNQDHQSGGEPAAGQHEVADNPIAAHQQSIGTGGGSGGNATQVCGPLPQARYSRHPSRHLHSPQWSPATSILTAGATAAKTSSGAVQGHGRIDYTTASGASAGYGHAAREPSARSSPPADDPTGQLGAPDAHQQYPYQSPASSRRRRAQDARQLAAPYVPYTRESYAAVSIGRSQGSVSASMTSSSRSSEYAGPVPRLNRQFQSPSFETGANYLPAPRTRSYPSMPMSDTEHDLYAIPSRQVPPPPPPQPYAQEWRIYGASANGAVDGPDARAASLGGQQLPPRGQRTSTIAQYDESQLETCYSGRDSSRSHPYGAYQDHDPRQVYPDAPRQQPHPAAHPPDSGYRPHHAYAHHDAQYWHAQYDPYVSMLPPPQAPLSRPPARSESAKLPPPMSPAPTHVSADRAHSAHPHNDQCPLMYPPRNASAANAYPHGPAADPCAPHDYYPQQYTPHYHHPSDRHLHAHAPPIYTNPYHMRPLPQPFYAPEYDPHAYASYSRPDAPYYPPHPHMYTPDDYYHHHMHSVTDPHGPLPPPAGGPDTQYYAHRRYPGPEAAHSGYPAQESFAYAQIHVEGSASGAAGVVPRSGRRTSRAAAGASGRAARGAAHAVRGADGQQAASQRDKQQEVESEEDEDEEEEEEDELEEEEEGGPSERGECADQARGDNEPGAVAEQKRRNYFVFSKVAYELMVRAIRVDRGLDELPEGMQTTQGTQHALEVAHWVCGVRRKKWTRLKARLDMDESQPFFRSLTWKKCTMQIIPREDWPDMIRQAHELTDEIGNVTHLSLKQTFRRLRSLCQTRRSRCGISKEACAEHLPQCSCSERKRQRAAVLQSIEARCAANKS